MAYVCPVCDAVEADAEHLANHLAVTASLREGDHATWLEAHAPDWPEQSPSELGATVVEHAREREVDGADSQTYPPDRPHERSKTPFEGATPGEAEEIDRAPDRETEQILREARELTRRSVDDGAE